MERIGRRSFGREVIPVGLDASSPRRLMAAAPSHEQDGNIHRGGVVAGRRPPLRALSPVPVFSTVRRRSGRGFHGATISASTGPGTAATARIWTGPAPGPPPRSSSPA
jgi:hypothetical protein